MANLQLPLNQDHEVLGSEYCSGYVDALGKWNTGFYCPASDESQDVFCCGNEYHKYCCTKKDQVIQSEVQDLTIVIGVLVGASAAILILTMVSCFCCSCCLLYKKRNPSATSSMYRLHHNSSEHSGVTNMYSLSNAGGSRSGTPQHRQHHQHSLFDEVDHVRSVHHSSSSSMMHNGGIAHSYTLPHNLGGHNSSGLGGKGAGGGVIHQYMTLNPHSSSYRLDHPDLISSSSTHQLVVQRPYGTLGRMPPSQPLREHPPPYQDFQGSPYAQFVQQHQQHLQMKQQQQMGSDGGALNSISRAVSEVSNGNGQTGNGQTGNGQGARMIFPHHQQQQMRQQGPAETDATLFHSTKF